MRNNLKRAAAIVAGSSILLSGIGSVFLVNVSVSAADCVIDTSTTYQNIRGFGGINHPEWAGDLTESQRATAFGIGADRSAALSAQSVTTFVISTAEAEPDPNSYLFHYTFENGADGFSGRGGAAVSSVSTDHFEGSKALSVSGRESNWHGASHALNTSTFKPGQSYSFSAVVKQNASASEPMHFSIEYKDAAGETQYAKIASGAAPKGEWVQLANPSYTIPAGATNVQFYFETDGDNGTTCDFLVDEVIAAPDGTVIDGPKASAFPSGKLKLGDLDDDGSITARDLSLAKHGLLKSFAYSQQKKAADVDQSGKADQTDVELIRDYLTGKITAFPVAEKPVSQFDAAEFEGKFGNVTLAKSYKKDGEHNPLISQYFGADPGVMEYDGRVYVYMTDDHLLYSGNQIKDIEYNSINCLRCISSDDLVNWTDHGLINAAGQNGICKWGGNSWAPTACHKKINGKEKFFLYFANGGNGIAVMTADSPTGPWTDPIGKALISRSTPNCGTVEWLFDPAVLVDDDGTGYLYFGGGVPSGQYAHPKTARAVQLGDDMTSIVGTPVTIDPPYLFEDSGIHKEGGKYYYSYCTNFDTNGNQYGLTSGAIDYMVSDNPLGPFTYQGEVFKGIGTFFGTGGNNHHTIFQFKGQYYLFYHAQYLQDSMGIKGGYRSTHIDLLTMNADGTMKQVTGTKKGVSQIKWLDPTETVRAATFSYQGGIQIAGSGDTTVTAEKGDWFRVSGVEIDGASTITVKASSQNGGLIKVCTGNGSLTTVAGIEVPAGGKMEEITVPILDCSGVNDLTFIFNNNISMDSWKLS